MNNDEFALFAVAQWGQIQYEGASLRPIYLCLIFEKSSLKLFSKIKLDEFDF